MSLTESNINMTNHVTNLVGNDDRRQGIGKCEDDDQMESISGTENYAKIDNEESKSSEKKKNTNTIAAIDKTSVHKICSGQVGHSRSTSGYRVPD